MIKFTKEEIRFCKQVAERYRKEINRGDWWIGANDRPVLAFGNVTTKHKLIPLWIISDCLEFLRGEGFYHIEIEMGKTYAHAIIKKQAELRIRTGGKTLLEACLKAVLAVLEKESK